MMALWCGLAILGGVQGLVSSLVEVGNTTMTGELKQLCADLINEVAATFTSEPHVTLGDKPQQLVREKASACSKLLPTEKDPNIYDDLNVL
jgi:hypothetical protein